MNNRGIITNEKYNRLKDFDVDRKRILIRVDINSPLGPNGSILDDTRFKGHRETLNKLRNSKVVLLAHQGRPGFKNFSDLKNHSEVFSTLLDTKIEYIDDIFGSCAKRKIESQKDGDILLLENSRFYSEEMRLERPQDQAKSYMVKELAPYFDLFINDAFAASHRRHISVTGFPEVLPSAAGCLMHKEKSMFDRILKGHDNPCIIIGGKKLDDSIKLIEKMLKDDLAEKILLTGDLAIFFLYASKCRIGQKNKYIFSSAFCGFFLPLAQTLLNDYKDNIKLPSDVAYESRGRRMEINVRKMCREGIKNRIADIGSNTIEEYSDIIKKSNMTIINGEAGVWKKDQFRLGTDKLLKATAESRVSIACAGGGKITAAIGRLGIYDKFDIVSTGGTASLKYLLGDRLPGLDALIKNKNEKIWSFI